MLAIMQDKAGSTTNCVQRPAPAWQRTGLSTVCPSRSSSNDSVASMPSVPPQCTSSTRGSGLAISTVCAFSRCPCCCCVPCCCLAAAAAWRCCACGGGGGATCPAVTSSPPSRDSGQPLLLGGGGTTGAGATGRDAAGAGGGGGGCCWACRAETSAAFGRASTIAQCGRQRAGGSGSKFAREALHLACGAPRLLGGTLPAAGLCGTGCRCKSPGRGSGRVPHCNQAERQLGGVSGCQTNRAGCIHVIGLVAGPLGLAAAARMSAPPSQPITTWLLASRPRSRASPQRVLRRLRPKHRCR